MAKPTYAEWNRFFLRRQIDNWINEWTVYHKTQFQKDFELIAFKLTDDTWHKAPKPDPNSPLSLRIHDLPRRLDIAPLLRMARLIGIQNLRYIFAMGGPSGSPSERLPYSVNLQKRVRNRNSMRAKVVWDAEKDVVAMAFGQKVLSLEAKGVHRGQAFETAAVQMWISSSSDSYRRLFDRFASLCNQLGYIPDSSISGISTRFSLTDLKAKRGRPKKQPQSET